MLRARRDRTPHAIVGRAHVELYVSKAADETPLENKVKFDCRGRVRMQFSAKVEVSTAKRWVDRHWWWAARASRPGSKSVVQMRENLHGSGTSHRVAGTALLRAGRDVPPGLGPGQFSRGGTRAGSDDDVDASYRQQNRACHVIVLAAGSFPRSSHKVSVWIAWLNLVPGSAADSAVAADRLGYQNVNVGRVLLCSLDR